MNRRELLKSLAGVLPAGVTTGALDHQADNRIIAVVVHVPSRFNGIARENIASEVKRFTGMVPEMNGAKIIVLDREIDMEFIREKDSAELASDADNQLA
jgi:hypothetical protein